MNNRDRYVEHTNDGYRAVVTDDSGPRLMIGYWYGDTATECMAVDPETVTLYPYRGSGPDPFDLACERRYDQY